MANYYNVTLEKQLSAKDSGEPKIHENRQKPKQRSAKISTRTRGGSDSTATAMLIRAQHVETTRGERKLRSAAFSKSVFQSAASRQRPEESMQHSADER